MTSKSINIKPILYLYNLVKVNCYCFLKNLLFFSEEFIRRCIKESENSSQLFSSNEVRIVFHMVYALFYMFLTVIKLTSD